MIFNWGFFSFNLDRGSAGGGPLHSNRANSRNILFCLLFNFNAAGGLFGKSSSEPYIGPIAIAPGDRPIAPGV